MPRRPAVLFVALALAYLAALPGSPYPGHVLLKAAPVLSLLLPTVQHTHGRTRNLLVPALLFSATGDVLLALDGLFLPGLGAFLVAQLCYAALFWGQRQLDRRAAGWAALVLVYVLSIGAYVLPRAGDFALPVAAYMVAISSMALTAGARRDPQWGWAAVGALLFLASDSMIAIERFVAPFPGSRMAVMVTYYAAEALLAGGVIRHALAPTTAPQP